MRRKNHHVKWAVKERNDIRRYTSDIGANIALENRSKNTNKEFSLNIFSSQVLLYLKNNKVTIMQLFNRGNIISRTVLTLAIKFLFQIKPDCYKGIRIT